MIREQALKQFEQQGLPTQRDEHWKYTPLRQLSNFLKAQPANCKSADAQEIFTISAPEGVVAKIDFANTIAFNQALDLAAHPFALMNTAQMQLGYEINIPANTVIDSPIVVTCHVTDEFAKHVLQIRQMVKLGVGSKAVVIFKYESRTEQEYFVNSVQEIYADEGAQLKHVIAQTHNDKAMHIEGVHIKQEANSNVKSYAVSNGAKLARFDIQAHYAAEGAECEMLGAYHVAGKQHVDFHLNAEHRHSHCRSKQFYRGIASDKAKAVFNGRVAIHPQASKSVSEQTNNNLLLSNTAEVDTKPELEVYHDDVKAAHGATVGQLDKDALFYLQARGVEKEKAEAMLRSAFLLALIDEIENPAIKKIFNEALSVQEDCYGY
jgi:Fe-S cluster assembly protein SufD